jgi:CRP-like cAMP-binding protein
MRKKISLLVFAFDNAFVSASDSFLLQTPSVYNVGTLTDSILWRLTYKNLEEIYAKTKMGNLIGRHASEELFLRKSKRELSLLNDPAKQRYPLKIYSILYRDHSAGS